jgi:two-component system phosphate regulon response regulator PhoB
MTADQAPDVALPQAPKRGTGAPSTKARRPSPLILILDYGLQQTGQFRRDLMSVGYEVDIVATDADAERHLREGAPDLMVLDFEVRNLSSDVARLRNYAERARVPIITLVTRESDGLRGLFAGADDFLVKPISSIHLIARVQSLLRRAKSDNPAPVARIKSHPVLRIKDVEVDLESHRVTRGGRDIHLSPTEYRILTLFVGNPGRIFSRQHLLINIWGDRPNTEVRTVDVYVSRLRRKLKRGFRKDALQTLPGVGYVMNPGRAGRG